MRRRQGACHGYRSPSGRDRLYRARDGKFMGVCQGLADYFCLSVFWVRVLVVLAALFTGFWPVLGIYVLLGLVLKPRPMVRFESDSDRDFYDDCVRSRSQALARLKERTGQLDARLRRMEDIVTRRDFDWERRFRTGR